MHYHSLFSGFILLCGVLFSGMIIRLLLKRRINERNSAIWLLGAIAILVVSANPNWLDLVAGKLGVDYPPSLLFLFSTLVLLIIVLRHSMQISVLNEKLRQLAQHVALQDSKIRQIEKQKHDQ
jgi:hypothetical protein